MNLSNIHNYIDKILCTLGSIFILIVLIFIVFTPKATGYEVSIYPAYPVCFWFFIIASLSCGIFILIHHAFFRTHYRSRWYLAGILIIIVTNILVITQPIFRDYFVSNRFDEVSHLGTIKDILLNGNIGNENFYPVSHILSSQVALLTSLDIRHVLKIMPSFFYLLYLAGLFLLAFQITKNIRTTILVMCFSTPLIYTYFNYLFFPTQFCLFFLPMLLFLFFKHVECRTFVYNFLFYVFLLVVPYLHPLGSIFIIAIFIFIGLSDLILHYVKKSNSVRKFRWNVIFPPTVILFILFFTWFHNFKLFRTIFIEALQTSNSPLSTIIEQTGTSGLTTLELVRLFINNYGHDLLMLILSLIAVFIISKKLFSKTTTVKTEEIFLSLIFIAFTLFYISTIVGSFMITGRSIRILCWALVSCVFINGFIFYDFITRLYRYAKIVTICFLTIIILSSTCIGLLSIFPSNAIKTVNFQVTLADMKGMQWFFDHKNSDDTLYFSEFISRAQYYIYGKESSKPEYLGRFYSIPQYVDNNVYLINTVYDMAGKLQFPDVGVYTLDELYNFQTHTGVNRIYFNGNVDVMEVLLDTWKTK